MFLDILRALLACFMPLVYTSLTLYTLAGTSVVPSP